MSRRRHAIPGVAATALAAAFLLGAPPPLPAAAVEAEAGAEAESLGAVHARMKARTPAIDKLKLAGKLGESNRGLLVGRAELAEKEVALVKAENEDRKTVYAAIARATGASPLAVAIQRAKQIAKRSAEGLWLQNPEGHWYRKEGSPPPAG